MSSMRHARNRLLFFLLFASYNILAILGTSDKMLFMEAAIDMPLLNIQLPLLAFYAVMPLFLLVLYFHLLYTFRSYRELLLNSRTHYPDVLALIPIGLYEGALLKQDSFHRMVRFAIRVLLYILPILVFTAFWFRFADYQSPILSLWHVISISIAVFLGFHFRGLLKLNDPLRSQIFKHLIQLHFYKNVGKNLQTAWLAISQIRSIQTFKTLIITLIIYSWKRLKKWRIWLTISAISLIFMAIILSYHYWLIVPFSRANIDLDTLQDWKKFEEKQVDANTKEYLKRSEWFLPRIVLNNEILVPIDKDQLEVLQQIKEDKPDNEALLLSVHGSNKQQRNFRLINLDSCILPNTNFQEAQLQGADLSSAQLQGADLSYVQLQSADFSYAQLQGTDLSYAQLQSANLFSAQLQIANLFYTQLQGADLRDTQLQGADLSYAQLQSANLFSAQLQGADLRNSKLQGANLNYAQLQGADLRNSKLQGANLRNSKLQGADLRDTQLQGADLRDAQLQGTHLRYTQLQGADLRDAQLQGADLSNAQLQGVNTSKNIEKDQFKQAKQTQADITAINLDILTKEKADKMIKSISSYISGSSQKRINKRLEDTKKRLYAAIDKNPIEWVKNQEGINLGTLSEEKFNAIAEQVTEPTARKRMGLPPLKPQHSKP